MARPNAVQLAALFLCCSGCTGDSKDPKPPPEEEVKPGDEWEPAYCKTHSCLFVMQKVAGADDAACNGTSPTDLGTTGAGGKRDCPFATVAPLRASLQTEEAPARALTVFIGEGTYPVYPFGFGIYSAATSLAEGVRLTSYRGQKAVLDGTCPATCEVDVPGHGKVTFDPCCRRPCPSCEDSPLCVPTEGGETACAVPIPHVEELLDLSGSYIRVEGLTLLGCFIDNVRLGYRIEGDPPQVVPTHHVYVANSVLEGCDVNENVKGLRNGPGPRDGGPAWGPTQIIGNEMYAMASQGVDATGVHGWTIEENFLRDAKVGKNEFIEFDGGGIGFKNGGSGARVRNNWLKEGGGLGLGGVAGSCISDTEPPTAWGCFQRWEMADGLIENNVVLDPARRPMAAYACDDCRYFGNLIRNPKTGAGMFLEDDCPGADCPDHNPDLEASRDLKLERNFIDLGSEPDESAGFAYFRDAHPDGPVALGMTSSSNVFCARSAQAAVADPEHELELFGHGKPTMFYALADFRAQIGDEGSGAYNATGAAQAACPAGPAPCSVGVGAAGVRWAAPCDDCTCSLAWDDVLPTEVACSGTSALPPTAAKPGRHYVGLRVNRAGGGTSCGVSYGVASPFVGAGCTIDVEGDEVRWTSSGTRCRLLADGGTDLGSVNCTGKRPLSPAQQTTGRHHVRLAVVDAADGQTTCGSMFNR